jgi:ABC-type lipoprotein release transport system permease subunit
MPAIALMAAVMLWVRAGWRRGIAGMVAVILLCGLAGAVVLTVAAGARRSSTALDRMTEATGAADVLVEVGDADPAVRDQIAQLPMVAESGAVALVFALVDGVDDDIGLFVPNDDRMGTTIEHDRVVRGRWPAPGRADEVALNEAAAEAMGVDVGDRIDVATMTPEQVATEDYFPAQGPALDLEVVGVTRGADDLVADGEAAILGTAALFDVVSAGADVFATYLGVRLAPGATIADFEAALRGDVEGGSELGMLGLDVRTKPARDAIDTLALGLAAFAVVAALASIVVVALAVGRHVAGAANQQDVLTALGMSRSRRVAGLVLLAIPIAIGGSAVAVAGAALASPLMPIGLARRAEPDPGFDVDWWVAGAGFAAVAATVLGSAALIGWRIVRTQTFSAPPVTAPSMPRVIASRFGAGPTAATGVQLAFDRRPPSIASKSALGAVTVAVLVVTGILTFSASLDRLLTSPARWGYPWQLMLNFTSETIDDATSDVADDHDTFTDVARWDSGFSLVDGKGTRAFGLTPLRGQSGFTLRSGHQPTAADEVVLGSTTADTLGVGIGDTVDVSPDQTVTPEPMRIVGIGLFPEIDDGNFTDGIGFFGSGFATHAIVTDLFETSQLVVALAPGIDVDDVAAEINERYPEAISGESIPSRPGGVANLTGIRRLPAAIAVFVVLLGLASLAHVLSTTARRRRRDLATLRCLGLTPRQSAACVFWQSLTIGAVGLALGIPLGLIAGRIAWWAVTDPIGVSPDLDRPFASVIILCIGTLIGAMLLATPVAWRAGRAAPARALRAE